mmetsp:Transcript_37108/g.32805  ORF Transcript_37108/g.32805 Transcript_37108/m.32805 type:complete len:507 (+) Transcript_37108:15-1535(+)
MSPLINLFIAVFGAIHSHAANDTIYVYYEDCVANSATQKFTYDSSTGLIKYTDASNAEFCAVATGKSDPVLLDACDSSNAAQKWTFTSDGQFKSTMNSCLDVKQNTGPDVDEWQCKSPSDSTVANQEFAIGSNGDTITAKVLTSFCLTAQKAGCQYEGWDTHQLKVDGTLPYSLINTTTPGVYPNQSEFGMEGGQILYVDELDAFYLFITEFTGEPLYVPSNLTLWTVSMTDFKNGNKQWTKVASLRQSGGTLDCNDTKASLGSSISAAFNKTDNTWYIFYVGFQSCKSPYFENQNGRIFLAKSDVAGIKGIAGPYTDIGVIIKYPDPNQQPWEGLQGVDSFSNPYLVNDTYYAFYGSAQTGKTPCCNQEVGLAYSKSYYGPWTRAPYPYINPVRLLNSPLEQPIVIQFKDGSYGAVFDALYEQNDGQIGYAYSKDGINWSSQCMQLLTVNPKSGPHWGDARTPEGLIPIAGEEGKFYLFFTGWDESQNNNNYEAFGYVNVSFIST